MPGGNVNEQGGTKSAIDAKIEKNQSAFNAILEKYHTSKVRVDVEINSHATREVLVLKWIPGDRTLREQCKAKVAMLLDCLVVMYDRASVENIEDLKKVRP